MEKEKIYCPVNGWDCPYWQEDGSCACEDVEENCDDFAAFWNFFDDVDETNYDPFMGQDFFDNDIIQ